MANTLDNYAAQMHDILSTDPGPAGRDKVCRVVQEMCIDKGFVGKYLPDTGPERNILYEDKDLGFCILGHVYHGAKESKPHDHGPTWAIYGQADGETIMNDWEMVSPPQDGDPGRVKLVRSYTLKPGQAYVYNEGDLHSPRREGSTRLIRIEGRNVEKIKRLPYEAI